jgi:hypothetical protein
MPCIGSSWKQQELGLGPAARLTPPLRGGRIRLGRFPRGASAAADFSWAIFDASLREEPNGRSRGGLRAVDAKDGLS